MILIYPKDSGIDSEKNIHHLKERHKRENGKHRHHSLKSMKKKTRLLIF